MAEPEPNPGYLAPALSLSPLPADLRSSSFCIPSQCEHLSYLKRENFGMLKRVYENNKLSTNPAAFRTRRGLEHTTVQSRQALLCPGWVGRHATVSGGWADMPCPGWTGRHATVRGGQAAFTVRQQLLLVS